VYLLDKYTNRGVKTLGNSILIALEESLMLEGLKFTLEQDGYTVDTAKDKREALKKADSKQYVLIIIDISSPQADGFNTCQKIRQKCNTPVIVITDNAEEPDKSMGVEGGPYDFIIKPINIAEFKSKVNSALVKASSKDNMGQGIIKLWDLTIDVESKNIFIGNREVELTSKEFEILLLLAQNKNKVHSREYLLEEIWGNGYTGDKRIVDVHIRRLREKIENDPSNPLYIMTKWGSGYYFNG